MQGINGEAATEQTCGHSGGRRGWDEWREQYGDIYITVCERDGQWEFAVRQGEFNPVLCDPLEGWDGVRGGAVQKGGDMCVPVADSC